MRDNDVIGAQIAVNNAVSVSVAKSVTHSSHDLQRTLVANCRMRVKQSTQRIAIDPLDRQDDLIIFPRERLMCLYNVRMTSQHVEGSGITQRPLLLLTANLARSKN